ncbi:hypothetical protein RIF29_13518 [Crotalaria pallida]|uniref:Uncharacterized protein n=1 Tax=Crotalaria pallida TaxID=3830 RepID=A0AAN9P256_CROPI
MANRKILKHHHHHHHHDHERVLHREANIAQLACLHVSTKPQPKAIATTIEIDILAIDSVEEKQRVLCGEIMSWYSEGGQFSKSLNCTRNEEVSHSFSAAAASIYIL